MKFWDFDDKSNIADYNETDFREYWGGKSKELLHDAECRILAQMLSPSQGWFVDLGAGFGRFVPTYRQAGRKIVLVDYASNHLEMAADAYADLDLHYIAADANHLPFRNGVFSAGICIRLIHHMPSAAPFLAEVSRIFERRARVLISYMNRRSLLRVLRFGLPSFERSHAEISRHLFGTHPTYFEQTAKAEGLKIRRMQGAGLIHQMTHEFKVVEDFVVNNRAAFRAATIAEHASGASLGRLKLALMQYALLEKEGGTGEASVPTAPNSTLLDILMCPSCRSGNLQEEEGGIVCEDCARTYPKKGCVYDFRPE